ncbi:N-6 DNA methylase [Rhodanobacter sp. PCA2]|uniref:N-6 DNA methylase n=1 Tax=Rhodanobacter sp. PCA2 TaxID=2006117 RepID=UPI0015E64804|nr:N-6 DNA methylase [Rhodanobacter sp. PCA2]MBA2079841.1 DNA methylase [Rhodanobacter sp. PCA2]
MTDKRLHLWLNGLGYDSASPSLHMAGSASSRHPYAPELHDLLQPTDSVGVQAVFDVEGVPTVGFLVDDGSLLLDEARLTTLRQRVWNQGLLSVLLVCTAETVVPVPVVPKRAAGTALSLSDARPDGPLSCADIQSGDVRERYPDWFRQEERVDRKLLANLRETVRHLAAESPKGAALSRDDAQYLVGQVLFVSYLEHRGIVSPVYRDKRKVGVLRALVAQRDRAGLEHLLARLKKDFNGDFLEPENGTTSLWVELSDRGYEIISDFLDATDLERAQPSFFPYNFRYIPVELLSGIYESFLGRDSKKQLAAYYTPRHLANLVVTQALEHSRDVLAERIFDGACGSGILLTTAFRRMLGEAEARRQGVQLSLRERITLLKEHIFGSDLSRAACKVTAFSLYLSLLERLEPNDIVALQEDAQVKLPTLQGKNLFSGDAEGDFFSPTNPHLKRRDLTLCLSNPPWMEPDPGERTSADTWVEKVSKEAQEKVPRALRQMAADYAWRAEDYLAENGRLCLILPMSLLLKSTSQEFLAGWLTRVIWRRVINFGDLKELLFDDGRFSCVVLLAERRGPDATGQHTIPPTETFEYWAPKADVGLAFGRLTLHGVDRHEVQTQAIAHSNRELVTRMWGDDFDLALWAKLRLRGTFGDLFRGPRQRWRRRKGFHRTDNAVPRTDWVSSRPLWDRPFIRPSHLYDCPVALPAEAEPFPRREITHLPRDPDDLMDLFNGPRILFPDGPAPDRSVRAAFVNGPASFMSSVGVIVGPVEDEDLLRFAAIYLRSDLVRYFMVTQLYQLLSDRDRVSLTDIDRFPFYPPERHPQPEAARAIVRQVADMTRVLERTNPLQREQRWMERRPDVERLLENYFGLNDDTQAMVHETVESILPAMRPYGLSRVFELARLRVSESQAAAYTTALRTELEAWRDARGGEGGFAVEAFLTRQDRSGPFGIVRVSLTPTGKPKAHSTHDDAVVQQVLAQLRQRDLLPLSVSDGLYFVPDVVLVAGDAVYLIKPQAERLWLRRQAHRDAERIVEATTQVPRAKERAA